MKMLRYQLNPHFLFNSLNAISALVLDHRNGDAEKMLLRLSRFLRQTLDADPTDLTRLGEELQLQRLYLDMEVARFGDKLRIRYDVPESLHDCLTPSLLLQPIVENAIKHGVALNPDVGRLDISAREANGRLQLAVENDGPAFAPAAEAEGLGLRNTHQRLAAIYGDDARLTMTTRPHGGARALIDLPLQR
jgi:two-component system, LytTR family, sensor kinase